MKTPSLRDSKKYDGEVKIENDDCEDDDDFREGTNKKKEKGIREKKEKEVASQQLEIMACFSQTDNFQSQPDLELDFRNGDKDEARKRGRGRGDFHNDALQSMTDTSMQVESFRASIETRTRSKSTSGRHYGGNSHNNEEEENEVDDDNDDDVDDDHNAEYEEREICDDDDDEDESDGKKEIMDIFEFTQSHENEIGNEDGNGKEIEIRNKNIKDLRTVGWSDNEIRNNEIVKSTSMTPVYREKPTMSTMADVRNTVNYGRKREWSGQSTGGGEDKCGEGKDEDVDDVSKIRYDDATAPVLVSTSYSSSATTTLATTVSTIPPSTAVLTTASNATSISMESDIDNKVGIKSTTRDPDTKMEMESKIKSETEIEIDGITSSKEEILQNENKISYTSKTVNSTDGKKRLSSAFRKIPLNSKIKKDDTNSTMRHVGFTVPHSVMSTGTEKIAPNRDEDNDGELKKGVPLKVNNILFSAECADQSTDLIHSSKGNAKDSGRGLKRGREQSREDVEMNEKDTKTEIIFENRVRKENSAKNEEERHTSSSHLYDPHPLPVSVHPPVPVRACFPSSSPSSLSAPIDTSSSPSHHHITSPSPSSSSFPSPSPLSPVPTPVFEPPFSMHTCYVLSEEQRLSGQGLLLIPTFPPPSRTHLSPLPTHAVPLPALIGKKDVNQKLHYSVKKDEAYDFSAAVNNNQVIRRHQKLFDQKKKSFRPEIRRSFCVSDNLNFYDKKSNDYQIRYYRNFSKNADDVFHGNKRRNRFLNENKICLIPTFPPPDPVAFRNENDVDDKRNKSEELSFVNLLIDIKKKSDMKKKTKLKRMKSMSKSSGSSGNDVENAMEDFLTPIVVPSTVARTNAYVQHGGLDSISSAGTESQIKTPSQTQVNKGILSLFPFLICVVLHHNYN